MITLTETQLLEIETIAQRKFDSGVGSYVVQPEVMLALVREARRARELDGLTFETTDEHKRAVATTEVILKYAALLQRAARYRDLVEDATGLVENERNGRRWLIEARQALAEEKP